MDVGNTVNAMRSEYREYLKKKRVCARLRHVASTAWGTKRYMSMKHLDVAGSSETDFVAG
jgi:hypothetical protein